MTAATFRSTFARTILAFACIYFIWGSTYLAIRIAIETMPPLVMAGIRFLIAGGLLAGWVAWRGEWARPTTKQWADASLLGVLFFLGGNGAVCWAETRMPSGLAALLVAMIPIWIVIFDWLRRGGTRPTAAVLTGVVAGFTGVALLVGRRGPEGGVDPAGAIVLTVGPAAWALGTVLSRWLSHPRSVLQSGAMQMLAGGVALCLAAFVLGEGSQFHPDAVSARSILAMLYLILAGSIIAFSAYIWLLQVASPARVGTYAFVNPIVAVVMGWTFAGETFAANTWIAALFILAGVILIVCFRLRRSTPAAGHAKVAAGTLAESMKRGEP